MGSPQFRPDLSDSVVVRVFWVVMLWIPAALWLDRAGSPLGVGGQFAIGAVTWALLGLMLRRASVQTRLQVGIVVVFATVIEYVFSWALGTYEYRLGGVPFYVPPGHGLVYLGALAFGRSDWARRRRATIVPVAQLLIVVLMVVGLVGPRHDVLGAFWGACLLGFLRWGSSTLVYVGCFIIVTWLEFLGTAWAVWTWAEFDPIVGVVAMGNPPSVAAGGYGWFDLAAITFAPYLAARLARRRSRAAECSTPLDVNAPGPASASDPV